MKKLAITSLLAAALAFAGCGGTDHSTMNHNGMNHNGMNHNAKTGPAASPTVDHSTMDHSKMDHSTMDHSAMKSDPDAAAAPYDLQFIDTMIAHHQGAVDMAKMIDGKTQNAELIKFGKQVVADQEKEIAQMKEWREKWFAGKPRALNMEMPGMADSMKMDMKKLAAARDKEFDRLFVEMMIPHHDGAVLMSKEALTKSAQADLKKLADQIIKAQEAEIKMMEDWKKKW